jgi:hypothetical protein
MVQPKGRYYLAEENSDNFIRPMVAGDPNMTRIRSYVNKTNHLQQVFKEPWN